MPPPQDFTLDIPIFAKLHDFYKNLSQTLTNFPKDKRFTLGNKLDHLTLEIIESVIAAGYSAREQKYNHLEKAQLHLEITKILIRLALDTKVLDNRKYIQLQQTLLEIGKMLGGWKRSLKM